jgi:hypothetical protein
MADTKTLIQQANSAFNKRDIDNPIVDHFINIEAGIPKRFSNRPLITPGALDAKSGGLMTVTDIVIVNDFIEDLPVPIVIGVIKTLNHVEIRF